MIVGYWSYCPTTRNTIINGSSIECRDFDVKGLSTLGEYTLDLEQVFVELSFVRKPLLQTVCGSSSDSPEALRIGCHSIWDYLSSKPLLDEHLVIIGVPGSGKTTLLQHMVLTIVKQKKQHQKSKFLYKMPIFLYLREYVKSVKETTSFSLVDAVQEQVSKWGRPAPSGWLEHRLEKGHCLILLDGLDEVADPETRQQMAGWVQRQMFIYGNNRFVITSRPHGYIVILSME